MSSAAQTPIVNTIIRRSHTKSKNGCQTCRARRIKCDEFRPQCHNCKSSGRSCEYLTQGTNDNPKRQETSLCWPIRSEQSCQIWKDSGKPPFPALNLTQSPSWHDFPVTELRHLHHLAVLASVLELGKARHFCAWWREFPFLFQLKASHRFVAYASMAHSTERLAYTTKLSVAYESTVRYRSLAFQGLAKAIDSFSKDNADAVLFASLCLSNQETDWRAWVKIMEGISSVVVSMRPWIHESAFFPYLDSIHLTNSPSNSFEYSELPLPEGLLTLVSLGIQSLNILSVCTKHAPTLSAFVRRLRDTLHLVISKPLSAFSAESQFRLMHPFASWMHEYNESYLAISEGNETILASLAHFYAVVVALAMAFPSTNMPLVVPIRLKCIEGIDKSLIGREENACYGCRVIHPRDELMAFPRNTVKVYRHLQNTRLGKHY